MSHLASSLKSLAHDHLLAIIVSSYNHAPTYTLCTTHTLTHTHTHTCTHSLHTHTNTQYTHTQTHNTHNTHKHTIHTHSHTHTHTQYTNNMVSDTNSREGLKPALGRTWSHTPHSRLTLHTPPSTAWETPQHQNRIATLSKSQRQVCVCRQH